jgi:hypothetical protein
MKLDVLLLRQAAEWHAKAAGTPEIAPKLFKEWKRKYRTDKTFRADIKTGARAAKEATDLQRAVRVVLRLQAEASAPFPDLVDELEERLLAKYEHDAEFRAATEARARYLLWLTLNAMADGKVPRTGIGACCDTARPRHCGLSAKPEDSVRRSRAQHHGICSLNLGRYAAFRAACGRGRVGNPA